MLNGAHRADRSENSDSHSKYENKNKLLTAAGASLRLFNIVRLCAWWLRNEKEEYDGWNWAPIQESNTAAISFPVHWHLTVSSRIVPIPVVWVAIVHKMGIVFTWHSFRIVSAQTQPYKGASARELLDSLF